MLLSNRTTCFTRNKQQSASPRGGKDDRHHCALNWRGFAYSLSNQLVIRKRPRVINGQIQDRLPVLFTMTASRRSGETKAQEEKLASILSSETFTVAEYLNVALDVDSNNNDYANKEDALQQRMTETALQLQYQAANFHEEIGRIGAELSAVLPRCAADVGRVGVGLQGLTMDCQKLLSSDVIQNDASDSDQAVSSSLQTLSTLHLLQEKLQRTKAILHAQATWDATLDTIHRHMADNKLPEAVHAMASLQEGRLALSGMPGAEERVEAAEKVRSAVQQMLKPALQNALAVLHTRVAPMQQCVGLYTALGDTEALITEYVQFRPSSLHSQWFAYDSNQQSLLEFINGWLDSVHSLVSEERRQTVAMFGEDEKVSLVVLKVRKCSLSLVQLELTQLACRYCKSAFVQSYLPFKAV